MKINLNQQCRIKLTVYGKARVWEYLASIFTIAPQLIPPQYEDLVNPERKWMLHEVMNILGKDMYMGNARPMIKSNEIEILEGNMGKLFGWALYQSKKKKADTYPEVRKRMAQVLREKRLARRLVREMGC